AEGADQHGPDLDIVRGCHAKRAGEGQSHDHTEQHFRYAFEGIEHSEERLGFVFWHALVPVFPLGMKLSDSEVRSPDRSSLNCTKVWRSVARHRLESRPRTSSGGRN